MGTDSTANCGPPLCARNRYSGPLIKTTTTRSQTNVAARSLEEGGVKLLIAFGRIRLRRIDGYRDLPRLITELDQAAA